MSTTIKFWCVHCEADFDASPLSSDLEQADCPTCSTICLSFQTEWNDARKNEQQSKVIAASVISVIGSWFGLAFPSAKHDARPRILDYAEAIEYIPEYLLVPTESEAMRLQRLLGDHGIIAGVRQKASEGTYYLEIEERDVGRARRVMER